MVRANGKSPDGISYTAVSEANNFDTSFGGCYSNFLPGSLIRLEVIFKNHTAILTPVREEIHILDSLGVIVWKTTLNLDLSPNGDLKLPLLVPVPKIQGHYTLTLGESSEEQMGMIPKIAFNAIQPQKSPRLSKILVTTPDFEDDLGRFIKTWDIKAPTFSWAQVLLCGKASYQRYVAGDPQLTQLISRALHREMSVIFLDFAPPDTILSVESKTLIPFGLTAHFIPLKTGEQIFQLKSENPELPYNLANYQTLRWNGCNGIAVPATQLIFEGRGVKIRADVSSGADPVQYPVVEIIPAAGKGRLILSQLITDGRIDDSNMPGRFKADLPAYDPMAVQFLLNLISSAVGDNLLK